MDEIEKSRITWVVLKDMKKNDSEKAVKETINSIKKLDGSALLDIEKEFKKISAQARVNLFAQMVEGLYNVCNLPDYIKTGILFNSASIHNQRKDIQGFIPESIKNKKDISYVG